LMFVATLTHSPGLCFGNPQYKEEGKKWIKNMRDSAKEAGVKTHGAYLCPNEHTFYFVLEAENLKAISDFLGPPMSTHHRARISPVMGVDEGFGLDFMK